MLGSWPTVASSQILQTWFLSLFNGVSGDLSLGAHAGSRHGRQLFSPMMPPHGCPHECTLSQDFYMNSKHSLSLQTSRNASFRLGEGSLSSSEQNLHVFGVHESLVWYGCPLQLAQKSLEQLLHRTLYFNICSLPSSVSSISFPVSSVTSVDPGIISMIFLHSANGSSAVPRHPHETKFGFILTIYIA